MHVLQEREIIFDDSSEFAATMHAFMIHCVNRYGIEELEKWYFEQWGDPRITLGEKYGKFFKVFETAYETIKRVSPNTSVGGAGFGRLYSTLDFRENHRTVETKLSATGLHFTLWISLYGKKQCGFPKQ